MHDCYSSLHESYMEEEMQSRQAFGFLRFAFGYIWKKKNFHYLRLYLDKTAGLRRCAFGAQPASA